ncbi:hypothetical protein ABCS02_03285 [Microbacterium sp. X-17]|uniref:hypothetical protein n=1 Tax=Microbacterium sp. X-17 TaxID=3144404 RepID=UPI0031F4CAB5
MTISAWKKLYPAATLAAAGIVLLSGAQSATASSTPAPNATQSFQSAVPNAARQLGISGRLSMWYVKDGKIHVGLSSVEGGDAAKLAAKL